MQVLQVIRTTVKRRNGKIVVAVSLKDCLTYLHFNIDRITYSFKKIGETNVALDFLKNESRDKEIHPKINGKKKKCAVISEDLIPTELLQELYRGTLYDI